MPKKLKIKLRDKLEYKYFYEAYLRAKKHKKVKRELLIFDVDLETNLYTLIEKIKNKTYHLGTYRKFIIYEPKRREILSLPFDDRIVHQWYIGEFIKPYIMKRFIKDSYACLEGRGMHLASLNIQKYMRKMKREYGKYYVIKCDIRKYFYSIDLDILFGLMKKFIVDSELLEFTRKMIYENATSKVGIPIGNYTSQFFANIYLNELDWYIKRDLHIKYYVRYMDDFVLLVENKEKAKEIFEKIGIFLNDKLKLTLNPKSRYFPNSMGIDFCGYRVFETHRLIRKRSVKKIKRRIINWNNECHLANFDAHAVLLSWNSFLNHSSHASCYTLQNKLFNSMHFVLEHPEEKFRPYLEKK